MVASHPSSRMVLVGQVRCAAVNNKNLARCYDQLDLGSLLRGEQHMPCTLKDKADIVEAMIGGTVRIDNSSYMLFGLTVTY